MVTTPKGHCRTQRRTRPYYRRPAFVRLLNQDPFPHIFGAVWKTHKIGYLYTDLDLDHPDYRLKARDVDFNLVVTLDCGDSEDTLSVASTSDIWGLTVRSFSSLSECITQSALLPPQSLLLQTTRKITGKTHKLSVKVCPAHGPGVPATTYLHLAEVVSSTPHPLLNRYFLRKLSKPSNSSSTHRRVNDRGHRQKLWRSLNNSCPFVQQRLFPSQRSFHRPFP